MLTKDYFQFFKGLEKNNSRDWFEGHRKEYEQHVKGPFRDLVQDMIDRIKVFEPDLQMEPKDAIFRINRDVRFSTDKSPYKTHSSAHISKHGKKAIGLPGFYFEINSKGGAIGGGCYAPDKEGLLLIRDLVMHEGKELHKLIKAKPFASKYGSIKGDRNKVLPAEFKAAAENEPLLYNKQFFWWAEIPMSVFLDKKCATTLVEYFKAGKPMADFFTRAFA